MTETPNSGCQSIAAEVSVSVIIPTTGRPEIKRALESVRCQTHTAIEVLVVLDAPQYEAEVRALLAAEEKLIVTAGGLGGGAARQMGLLAASSRFVAFLDDDDWWEPDKTRIQLVGMLNSRSSFSSTCTIFHDTRGSKRLIPRHPFDSNASIGRYLVERRKLTHGDGYIQTSSLMVRRDLALEVGWNESLRKHQDWDFVIRLIASPDCRYYYCRHPVVNVVQGTARSISRKNDCDASIEWYELHRESLDEVAAGDFLFTQVGRSSLSAMDFATFKYFVVRGRKTKPHFAAWVVLLSGLLRGMMLRAEKSRARSSVRVLHRTRQGEEH